MSAATGKDIHDTFVRHDVFDRPVILGPQFDDLARRLRLGPHDVALARQHAGRTIAELRDLSPADYERNLRLLFLLAAARAVRFEKRPPAAGDDLAPRPTAVDLNVLGALFSDASRLLREKNPRQAQERLRRAVELYPSNSKVLALCAWTDYLLCDRSHPDAAEGFKDRLKKAIALDDANADAYLYLGKILHAEGKNGLAQVLFAHAEKLKPTDRSSEEEAQRQEMGPPALPEAAMKS